MIAAPGRAPVSNSPMWKLNFVFLVIVVGSVVTNLPFVDHSGVFRPL